MERSCLELSNNKMFLEKRATGVELFDRLFRVVDNGQFKTYNLHLGVDAKVSCSECSARVFTTSFLSMRFQQMQHLRTHVNDVRLVVFIDCNSNN